MTKKTPQKYPIEIDDQTGFHHILLPGTKTIANQHVYIPNDFQPKHGVDEVFKEHPELQAFAVNMRIVTLLTKKAEKKKKVLKIAKAVVGWCNQYYLKTDLVIEIAITDGIPADMFGLLQFQNETLSSLFDAAQKKSEALKALAAKKAAEAEKEHSAEIVLFKNPDDDTKQEEA